MSAEESASRTCIINDAFVQRRGYHAVEYAFGNALICRVQQLQDITRIGGIEPACFARRGKRNMQNFNSPWHNGTLSALPDTKSRKTTFLPNISARCANRPLSPKTTGRHGNSANAKSKQISGPIPAGSPEVTANTGRDMMRFLNLDKGCLKVVDGNFRRPLFSSLQYRADSIRLRHPVISARGNE